MRVPDPTVARPLTRYITSHVYLADGPLYVYLAADVDAHSAAQEAQIAALTAERDALNEELGRAKLNGAAIMEARAAIDEALGVRAAFFHDVIAIVLERCNQAEAEVADLRARCETLTQERDELSAAVTTLKNTVEFLSSRDELSATVVGLSDLNQSLRAELSTLRHARDEEQSADVERWRTLYRALKW